MTSVFNFIPRGPGRNEVFEIRTKANVPVKLTTSANSRLLEVMVSNPNGRKWVTGRVDVDAVALPSIRKVIDRILADFALYRPNLSAFVEMERDKSRAAGSLLRVTIAPGASNWNWASPTAASGALPSPDELNDRTAQGAFGLVFSTITYKAGQALYLNISLKTAAVTQIVHFGDSISSVDYDQLLDMDLSLLDDDDQETERNPKKQ